MKCSVMQHGPMVGVQRSLQVAQNILKMVLLYPSSCTKDRGLANIASLALPAGPNFGANYSCTVVL